MMNTTTAITLNDRFSMIKTPSQTRMTRGRSRSRSRGPSTPRRQKEVELRGSQRNRKLLNKLERQHKLRIAMKLKNKSIMTTRGRVQGQNARQNIRRAATIKKTMNLRNLRRANSMTTFVPLRDSPSGRMNRGRSRSRSRSRSRMQQNNLVGSSIQDRLGIPNGRRRMRRGGPQANGNNGGAVQRSRSRSRVRLNRNNFRNNNNNNNNNNNFRNGSVPLKRSNSVNTRLGGNGPANPQIRRQRRFRSQSRNNNSINNGNRLNRPLAGRIIKRKNNLKPAIGLTKQVRRQNAAGNAIRNAKRFKRGQQAGIARNVGGGNQGVARGRARNRGQMNNNNNRNNNNNNNNNQRGRQQQRQQSGRRGRSRTRRGGAAAGGGGGRQKISKEQLDKQLDDYMSKA